MTPHHTRPDGTFVVILDNGLPYHVTPDDPLHATAAALDWSNVGAEPEPPPIAVPAPLPDPLEELRDILLDTARVVAKGSKATQADRDGLAAKRDAADAKRDARRARPTP